MARWSVTTTNTRLEFDTESAFENKCFQIDSTHYLNIWQDSSSDGRAQVFTVNTSTWAVTTAAAALEFETVNYSSGSLFLIDTNHFINFYSGSDSDGYVEVFEVNTTTWAVTTTNTRLEFNTQDSLYNSCAQIDSTHFINTYRGVSADGFAQVFTVDTSTWAVTTASAALEFDTRDYAYGSIVAIDTNHFLLAYKGGGSNTGVAQVFTVNTSTWAVTTASARVEFNGADGVFGSVQSSLSIVDANHFINFYGNGRAQVLAVNTSTWAVSTNANLQFDSINGTAHSSFNVDTNHFINFYSGSDSDGYVEVFEVNTTTWAVTTTAARLEFDTDIGNSNTCFQVDTSHFINFYRGTGFDGFVEIFQTNLKLENISDNFNDNSINAGLWNDDNVSETGGQLSVTVNNSTGTYNGLATDYRYDLTESNAYIELVSAGDTSLSFTTYILELYNDTVDLYWGIEYGATDEIVAYKSPDSAAYTEKYRATYDSSVHKWFRIRESGGTTYWDTSSDGTNWTNRASDATGYDLTALNAFFGVENPASGSTTVVFDNFNVPPVGGGGGTSVQDLIAPGIIPFAR